MARVTKRMTKGRWICLALAITLCAVLGLGGCAPTPPSYFSFREQVFCAEVKGVLNQTEIGAKIGVTPTGEGYEVTVEYLAPPSLQGTCLTARCTADGVPTGNVDLRRGENSFVSDAAEVRELLRPATAWLADSAYSRVERNDDGYLLTFPENGRMQLTSACQPLYLWHSSAEFWIIWLDFSENNTV